MVLPLPALFRIKANQEKVWKAEQRDAAEKRRIEQLQKVGRTSAFPVANVTTVVLDFSVGRTPLQYADQLSSFCGTFPIDDGTTAVLDF